MICDGFNLFINPGADPAEPYAGGGRPGIIGKATFAAARDEIASWPGYAPTRLPSLRGLAGAARIGAIFYKDEAARFGLGSFKALGGAYAVPRARRRKGGAAADITVTFATDGNHGRSVAWGAHMLGCRCVIYMHERVSQGRRDAIAR